MRFPVFYKKALSRQTIWFPTTRWDSFRSRTRFLWQRVCVLCPCFEGKHDDIWSTQIKENCFFRFFQKKKGERKDFRSARISENFCSKKRKNWKCNEKKHEKTEKMKTHKFERGEESKNSKEREGSKRSKAGPYTPPNSRSPAFGGNYWYINTLIY